MSNEDLQRELECPICFNYLQIPIRMCITGHSICDTCRNKLIVCPICESGFSNGSNISLESIIPLLKFPCKFRDRGCQNLLFHCDRLAHETDCSYKGINCPGCSFNGSITDMEKHCRDTHSVQNLEEYNCSMFFFEILVNSSVNGIVQKDGKYFWLKALKSSENNILFSVEMVGTKEEASNYRYKLIFNKEIQKMCFEDTCKPLGFTNKQLPSPVKSFNLSVSDIDSFLGNDWNISITVENIKLNHKKYNIKLCLYVLFSILLVIVLYYIIFQQNWFSEKSKKSIKYKHKQKNESYNLVNYFNDFLSSFWSMLVITIILYLIEYFIKFFKKFIYYTYIILYYIIILIIELLRFIITNLR
ncbi:E3 ubiquitin-protein ligase Siah1-like [Diabrotica undecimpunctata]|uniref:E3 ubiquitin-protein ligase Siah1-like n=1 Tax=Diabrotica undecimpunctata TaxID=50387 RepID=UPI003B63BF83